MEKTTNFTRFFAWQICRMQIGFQTYIFSNSKYVHISSYAWENLSVLKVEIRFFKVGRSFAPFFSVKYSQKHIQLVLLLFAYAYVKFRMPPTFANVLLTYQHVDIRECEHTFYIKLIGLRANNRLMAFKIRHMRRTRAEMKTPRHSIVFFRLFVNFDV